MDHAGAKGSAQGDGKLGRALGVVSFFFALGFILILSAYKVNSYDIPWHVKTGEWIIDNLAVPRVDFWNFTRQGMEWIDAQWLFQVISYAFYRAGGGTGLSIMVMVLASSTMVLLLFSTSEKTPLSIKALIGVIFALSIDSRIMARPELLTCLYMAVMYFVLERAAAGKTRLLILAPAVQVLWANSQGLWPIGLVILGSFLADMVSEAIRKREFGWRGILPWPWLATLAACVAACFVQPYGLKGFLFPLELFGEVATGATLQKKTIVEIQSMFADPPALRAVKFFFLSAASAAITSVLAGKKVRPFQLLVGAAFFYLAVNARRNVSVASVSLIHLTLVNLDVLFIRPFSPSLVRKASLSTSAVTVVISLLLSTLTLIQPYRNWDRTGREPGLGFSYRYYPVESVDYLKSIGYKGKVITSVRLGGYLYFAGWPDWTVMADPRMEIKGEYTLDLWRNALRDPLGLKAIEIEYRPEAAVLDLWDAYLRDLTIRMIDDPSWVLVQADGKRNTVVFLKKGTGWDEAIQKAGKIRLTNLEQGHEAPVSPRRPSR